MASFRMSYVLSDINARSLFKTGAPLSRWAWNVNRVATRAAEREAPVNKRMVKSHRYRHLPRGSLKNSIVGHQNVSSALMQVNIEVVCYVPYANYVLKGTDRITSSRKMFLPANPPYRRTGHYSVSGQEANNFLVRGLQHARYRHPSIPYVDE